MVTIVVVANGARVQEQRLHFNVPQNLSHTSKQSNICSNKPFIKAKKIVLPHNILRCSIEATNGKQNAYARALDLPMQVATQLGLLDDAVRLYRECGRYDLLNGLYQASGLWERALEVAEANDGINLSTTHQLYAQHLEKVIGREGEREGLGIFGKQPGFTSSAFRVKYINLDR